MKHYLSVASVFKNESWNLKEWVLHYKHHGVDHIYLVNDFSDDDTFINGKNLTSKVKNFKILNNDAKGLGGAIRLALKMLKVNIFLL